MTFRVLLLERGDDPDETNNTQIPIKWANNLKTNVDYQYLTEPDDYLFKGLEGQVARIPAGKMSGGSSSLNVGLYIRGFLEEFDVWEYDNCTDWNSQTVLKYFKKAEDYNGNIDFKKKFHGIGGPLSVTPLYSPDPAIPIIAQSLIDMGLPELDDLNGNKSIGFGFADSTTKHGLRWSTFKGYISIAAFRSNFFYARNTLVKRVVFHEEMKIVIGVEILTREKTCVVYASKEVILSAGAIATPQILMLSGIGPAAHLNAIEINVIADVPAVGQYLQDHVVFLGTVFSDGKFHSKEQVKSESSKLIKDTYVLMNQAISTMGLTELVAFIDTTRQLGYPNIELMFMRQSYQSMMQTENKKHRLFNMFGYSKETADLFTKLNNETDLIFVLIILLDVRSTGYIELKSKDATVYPKIYTQYLRDENEVNAMLEAIKFVEEMANMESMKNAQYILEPIPYKECTCFEKFTDEYWMCAIRQIATEFFHPACSARMGSEDDVSAVVNPRLQVKGVTGLRVVDASVMRFLVYTNPNAATIMIAEKAADMIKEDYNKSTDYYYNVYPYE